MKVKAIINALQSINRMEREIRDSLKEATERITIAVSKLDQFSGLDVRSLSPYPCLFDAPQQPYLALTLGKVEDGQEYTCTIQIPAIHIDEGTEYEYLINIVPRLQEVV